MATVVANQQHKIVEVVEEDGAVVGITTSALIHSISATSSVSAKWAECFAQLDSDGYAVGDTTAVYTGMRLRDRKLKAIAGSTDKMEALLYYRSVGLGYDIVGNFVPRIRGTVNAIQTEFDIYGNPLTVSHTYTNDQKFGNQTDTIVAQGTQLQPQVVIEYTGQQTSDLPINVALQYLGRKNSTYWNGGAPGQWLCIDVSADARDLTASPKLWDWVFGFQRNNDGWDARAVYKRPDTNRPPNDIVFGVGVVDYEMQPYANFNTLFPG